MTQARRDAVFLRSPAFDLEYIHAFLEKIKETYRHSYVFRIYREELVRQLKASGVPLDAEKWNELNRT